MFGLILLGVVLIIKGILHICGLLTRMGKRERKRIKQEDSPSYLRVMGILECITGILIICMTIIREYYLLPVWLFFTIYVILSVSILLGCCIVNKKYLGRFML